MQTGTVAEPESRKVIEQLSEALFSPIHAKTEQKNKAQGNGSFAEKLQDLLAPEEDPVIIPEGQIKNFVDLVIKHNNTYTLQYHVYYDDEAYIAEHGSKNLLEHYERNIGFRKPLRQYLTARFDNESLAKRQLITDWPSEDGKKRYRPITGQLFFLKAHADDARIMTDAEVAAEAKRVAEEKRLAEQKKLAEAKRAADAKAAEERRILMIRYPELRQMQNLLDQQIAVKNNTTGLYKAMLKKALDDWNDLHKDNPAEQSHAVLLWNALETNNRPEFNKLSAFWLYSAPQPTASQNKLEAKVVVPGQPAQFVKIVNPAPKVAPAQAPQPVVPNSVSEDAVMIDPVVDAKNKVRTALLDYNQYVYDSNINVNTLSRNLEKRIAEIQADEQKAKEKEESKSSGFFGFFRKRK